MARTQIGENFPKVLLTGHVYWIELLEWIEAVNCIHEGMEEEIERQKKNKIQTRESYIW